MNIYRNSSQFVEQATYPTNAVFNTIETTGLKIDGGRKGDILIFDASSSIEGVQLGPQGYVLTANTTTGIPAYTNALTLNSLTTTSLTIPGTMNGDILVMNGAQTAERLAIGGDSQYLRIEGGNPQWQAKSYCYALVANSTFANFNSTTIGTFTGKWSINMGVNFTCNSSLLTYTGATNVFKISANLSLTADQDNSLWYFFIYHNGVPVSSSLSQFQLKSNDWCNLTAICALNLNPSDTISAGILRGDGGANANVQTALFGVVVAQLN